MQYICDLPEEMVNNLQLKEAETIVYQDVLVCLLEMCDDQKDTIENNSIFKYYQNAYAQASKECELLKQQVLQSLPQQISPNAQYNINYLTQQIAIYDSKK